MNYFADEMPRRDSQTKTSKVKQRLGSALKQAQRTRESQLKTTKEKVLPVIPKQVLRGATSKDEVKLYKQLKLIQNDYFDKNPQSRAKLDGMRQKTPGDAETLLTRSQSQLGRKNTMRLTADYQTLEQMLHLKQQTVK